MNKSAALISIAVVMWFVVYTHHFATSLRRYAAQLCCIRSVPTKGKCASILLFMSTSVKFYQFLRYLSGLAQVVHCFIREKCCCFIETQLLTSPRGSIGRRVLQLQLLLSTTSTMPLRDGRMWMVASPELIFTYTTLMAPIVWLPCHLSKPILWYVLTCWFARSFF